VAQGGVVAAGGQGQAVRAGPAQDRGWGGAGAGHGLAQHGQERAGQGPRQDGHGTPPFQKDEGRARRTPAGGLGERGRVTGTGASDGWRRISARAAAARRARRRADARVRRAARAAASGSPRGTNRLRWYSSIRAARVLSAPFAAGSVDAPA